MILIKYFSNVIPNTDIKLSCCLKVLSKDRHRIINIMCVQVDFAY